MAAGETTTYRADARGPVSCALGGTTYTWIPVAKFSGWVASVGLAVCGDSCVRVNADRLNIRGSPCGAASSSLASGAQARTTGTAISVGTCFGRSYLWVPITGGFAAADFLTSCSGGGGGGGTPPPPAPQPSCKANQRPTAIGQRGINIIKEFEGKRNCWYLDPVGIPTICYGYANPPYSRGTCLSDAQCENLLRTKVVSYANCVRDSVTVPINQNQFDALTSFTYNVGCGGWRGSSARTSLNAGRYQDVCAGLKLWTKGGGRVLPGLVRRRNSECDLFNSCNGIAQLAQAVSCPPADPCHACMLNSDEGILAYYQGAGFDISCSAANWKRLYDHYCNSRDPWDCYYKSASGNFGNVTSVCGVDCPALPVPTVPDTGSPLDLTCISNVDLCPGNDCDAQLANATCDPLTGGCVLPGEPLTKTSLPLCKEETTDAAATNTLAVLLTLFSIYLALN